jgi:UDP-N-acetylmuramoyl-tripeptide--D-alanyl-D-alanine ligase
MIPLSLATIAEWTDGALIQGVPSDVISSVTTDSRKVTPGQMFVAIKGEVHDAHRFIPDAIDAGASALLVSGLPVETEAYSGGVIRVKDTLAAMQRLAWSHRRNSQGLTVIGVTGSNGKTSTKDFLAAALATLGQVNATAGNFNNHLGLPLTILAGRSDDRFGVWEMGMNHPGEISALADIGEPDVAVITNIGTAHIEYMGTREAIAAEKASLAEAIPADGFCAMPISDPFYSFVAERCAGEMMPVGFDEGVVRACDITPQESGGIRFQLISDFGPAQSVQLPVRGRHMVMNALLAAAVALRHGAAPERVARALGEANLNKGRLQERLVGGVAFLDDTYNANPDSMRAALSTLRETPAERRIAVFGFMGELGEHAEREHFELGAAVVASGVDFLLTVGARARGIHEGAATLAAREYCESHEDAAAFLKTILQTGDLVLVKGSRSAAMEKVINLLA